MSSTAVVSSSVQLHLSRSRDIVQSETPTRTAYLTFSTFPRSRKRTWHKIRRARDFSRDPQPLRTNSSYRIPSTLATFHRWEFGFIYMTPRNRHTGPWGGLHTWIHRAITCPQSPPPIEPRYFPSQRGSSTPLVNNTGVRSHLEVFLRSMESGAGHDVASYFFALTNSAASNDPGFSLMSREISGLCMSGTRCFRPSPVSPPLIWKDVKVALQ